MTGIVSSYEKSKMKRFIFYFPPKFKKILQNIKYSYTIKNKNIRKRGSDMISDEMAYRQYLDGKEESADILVERYGDALTYYINGYIHDIHEFDDRGLCTDFCKGASD